MLMSVRVSACMRAGVPVCERAFMMHEHCETIVRELSTSVYCKTADSSREKTLLFYQIQTYNTYRVAVRGKNNKPFCTCQDIVLYEKLVF